MGIETIIHSLRIFCPLSLLCQMEDKIDRVSALSGLTGTGRHSKQISQLMSEQDTLWYVSGL